MRPVVEPLLSGGDEGTLTVWGYVGRSLPTPGSRYRERSFTACRIDGLSLPRLTAANLGCQRCRPALLDRMAHGPLQSDAVEREDRSCGPRSDPHVVGPELRGSESGMDHDVRWTFERVTHVARPVTVGGATGERVAQLPVVGRIDTYLDGELAKGTIGGMQPTHAGMVMHENPATSAVRPNCVIEGTRFQLETPARDGMDHDVRWTPTRDARRTSGDRRRDG